MPKEALIVYNPAAKTVADPNEWLRRIVHDLCEIGQYAVSVYKTDPDNTPQDLAARLKPPISLVVAAGGDGTVGFVLSALARAGSKIPAAIVPLGTINVMARKLGILDGKLFSHPLENALNTIFNGHPMRIDLGMMNDEYFAVTAGAGPLSEMFVRPTRDEKTHFKILAYWNAMLQAVAAPPVTFTISTDLSHFQVLASGVFVSNVDDLGLGSTDHNVAELADGLLTIYVINPLNFGDYVDLGFRFGGGIKTTNKPYFVRKIREVSIDILPTRSPLSTLQRFRHRVATLLAGKLSLPPRQKILDAMIDGDRYGTTPLNIKVVPNAVTVLLPPEIEAVSETQPSYSFIVR